MSLWKKKPITIEAFRWTGGPDQTEDPLWAVEAIKAGTIWFGYDPGKENAPCLVIATLEGSHIANPGDWIIKGIKGELYPCKPEIFAATYEPA